MLLAGATKSFVAERNSEARRALWDRSVWWRVAAVLAGLCWLAGGGARA